MPGRTPTPTKLKLVHGNPGKRPLNKREPKPAPGRPACPIWLPVEARAEWRRITRQLDGMQMLHAIDRGLLAAWAVAWSQFHEATKRIELEGYFYTTDKGNVIQHPAAGLRNRAIEHMLKLAGQFGLSPAARTRIQTANEPEQDLDPLQEIIARGQQARNPAG